jgi:hypothetical protein
MPRKQNPQSFESRHPEAAAAVERWFFVDQPPLDCDAASARLRKEFGVQRSPEALRQFWHRLSERRLRDRIVRNARKANEVVKVFEQNPAETYRAVIGMIGQIAFDEATADETLDVEALTDLTKLLIAARKEDTSAQALEFDREKFKESLRTKLEAGLDAVAAAFKGNTEAMKLYQQARAMISRETR